MTTDQLPPDTTEQPSGFIPADECIDRMVYRIRSRNLAHGVFRKDTGGFIGIREKFGEYYLFEEYHHDISSFVGTVRPEMAIEMLPEGIEAKETIPMGCSHCGGEIHYEQTIKDRMDATDLTFKDEAYEWPWVCENGCQTKGLRPSGTRGTYAPLFDYLSELEVREITESPAWASPWIANEELINRASSRIYKATRPLGHRGMKVEGGYFAKDEAERSCYVCGLTAQMQEDGSVTGGATTERCVPRADADDD
jgi:hypothetical protein